MPLYVVDTIVTYRIKYVVEAKELVHAFDEVVCNDGTMSELTQKCLGEQIIEGREITKEEFRSMYEEYKNDPDESCAHWMGDSLINARM